MGGWGSWGKATLGFPYLTPSPFQNRGNSYSILPLPLQGFSVLTGTLSIAQILKPGGEGWVLAQEHH